MNKRANERIEQMSANSSGSLQRLAISVKHIVNE